MYSVLYRCVVTSLTIRYTTVLAALSQLDLFKKPATNGLCLWVGVINTNYEASEKNIFTDEKVKFVAASWETESLQFLAALAILSIR